MTPHALTQSLLLTAGPSAVIGLANPLGLEHVRSTATGVTVGAVVGGIVASWVSKSPNATNDLLGSIVGGALGGVVAYHVASRDSKMANRETSFKKRRRKQ